MEQHKNAKRISKKNLHIHNSVRAGKQIYQNNGCGCEIGVYHSGKMLHMWINVTVNCFLQD